MENSQKPIFTQDELLQMQEIQGKPLKKVLVYLWQNKLNAGENLEIIDAVRFLMDDNSSIILTSNAENSALALTEFDFLYYKRQMESELNNSIIIHEIDAGRTGMWRDTIDKSLTGILITKENDNYLSDSIVMNFEGEKRSISISPIDGLLLDFYEE